MAERLDPVALAKLQNLELRARSVVEGALSGLHKSPHHGSSVEFSEHKEYYAGAGVSKLEYARTMAASLAYLLLRQQDQVGMVAFGEKLSGYVPPRARGGHLADLLIALGEVTAQGRTELARALSYLSEVAQRRALLIIFSDLLDSAGSD